MLWNAIKFTAAGEVRLTASQVSRLVSALFYCREKPGDPLCGNAGKEWFRKGRYVDALCVWVDGRILLGTNVGKYKS